MSWLRIPTDSATALPEEIAALRTFFVSSWADSITEQAVADPDLTAADLESMLRLLEDKVLHVWSDDKVVAIARAIVRRAELRPVDYES